LDAYSKVAGIEKTARIWSRPVTAVSDRGDCSEPWSDRFKGTPFYKKAQVLERTRSGDRIADADREVKWSERALEDARFRVKIASAEKELADWSFSQESSEKLAFQEKLAECRYRSFKDWSDYFKGSPFYKTAMSLEVEDAKREAIRRRDDVDERGGHQQFLENSADRADLESELACWRLEQMGFNKTASVKIAFSPYRDQLMSLSEHTISAFFTEIDEIEKTARVSRGAAASLAALAAGGGTAAVAIPVSHRRGRRKGQHEGVRVGYRAGAQRGYRAGANRGYRAGQIAMARRVQAARAKKKKGKEKTAVVGWLTDASNLGIPSGIGYALGRGDRPESRGEARREAERDYNYLAGAVIPGYTGWHYGKKSRAKDILDKMDHRDRRRARNAEKKSKK